MNQELSFPKQKFNLAQKLSLTQWTLTAGDENNKIDAVEIKPEESNKKLNILLL